MNPLTTPHNSRWLKWCRRGDFTFTCYPCWRMPNSHSRRIKTTLHPQSTCIKHASQQFHEHRHKPNNYLSSNLPQISEQIKDMDIVQLFKSSNSDDKKFHRNTKLTFHLKKHITEHDT